MLGDTKVPAIQAKYPADQPLTADAEFMAWIADLERVMVEWGGADGPLYSIPLIDGTGLECWHRLFVDGLTPKEAFDDDMSDWQ